MALGGGSGPRARENEHDYGCGDHGELLVANFGGEMGMHAG